MDASLSLVTNALQAEGQIAEDNCALLRFVLVYLQPAPASALPQRASETH